jgi:hypothetical protein
MYRVKPVYSDLRADILEMDDLYVDDDHPN